jgi:gluconolactonase
MVATGFQFTEGPVWQSRGGFLLFSDIPADRIYALDKGGRAAVYREPSGHSNGLTFDAAGCLLTCEHGNRRVSREEPGGPTTVVADRFQGKRLNSPNDLVVKSDGSVYFTDPPYGVRPEEQELAVHGVFRVSAGSTDVELLAEDFVMPNGLAFSPSESRLYIDDSAPERRHIRVFDVATDGTLVNGRLFHDMNVQEPGAPDGMKVDVDGRLYCTGAGGVWVFGPDGTHLGTIVTPEKPANCAWGDEDWRTLYITARTSIYRIPLRVGGIALPH